MTSVVRDPVILFRFALREGDLILAGGLAQALRGERIRKHLQRELERARPGSGRSFTSLGALGAFAHLVRSLGLNGGRDYDRE